MADLTKKLSVFFESECKTFNELDAVLTESNLQKDWLDAVALYRQGMIALQKNDLKGLESIAAANEALKKVASSTNRKENTENAIKAFNESIEKINKDNINESIVNLKLAFSNFYNIMKKSGYNELVNESNFYDDGEKLLKEAVLEEEPILEPETEKGTTVTADAVSPTVTPTVTPTEKAIPQVNESSKEKRSAYQEGFDAGRKSWSKEAKNHREQLETTITQGLSESPYNYVTRFSEGFAAGFSHERMVQEDVCPECFKQDETGEIAK